MKFLEILEETLKQDSRFVGEDGRILKTKVYDACMGMDGLLLERLINNETLKSHFFAEVNGALVFDKMKYAWVLESREFLPDSYTRFKNKIGLADSRGDLISHQGDITLVWPYKDCVIEGGQTKEDQKRNEIFNNETLAPDEVNRLLYPKVFTNAKRYSENGVEEITEIKDTDNLIIKGNNLLALASLLMRYEGQVKCIYIDPPYNTHGDADSFSYNNSFNHSSWLTFMKNRLELAYRLLKKDGFMTVAIDHAELFYLGVLCDEIFGTENRISIITVQHNPKGRNQAKFFSANCEYLLVYAKNKALAEFNQVAIDDEVLATFTEIDESGRRYRWEPYIRARTVWSREARPDNWYPIYVSKDLEDITSQYNADYYELWPITNTGEFSWKNIKETFDELNRDNYFKAEITGDKVTLYHRYYEQQVLKNVWTAKKYQSEFHGTNLIKKMIGKNKFSYPKSLYAVMDIIQLMVNKDDIVLDFFAGSGTTAHAVSEINKRRGTKIKYILCEQLQYHAEIVLKRINAVIEQDKKGSFVYCELMEQNESIVTAIQAADTSEDVQAILNLVTDDGLIIPSVLPDDLRAHMDEFAQMPLEQQKKLVMELIDKNKLYVNLCDMDDEELAVNDADKAFTRCFYRMDERGGM
jgi:adenine-specific DNA-methyltransferase